MSQLTVTILTSVLALLGILTVGVLVPLYLVARAERSRREDAAEAAKVRREDREAEWARQDEVAARVTQAQVDLAESQKRIADQAEEAAKLLLANNAVVAETQVVTNGKLDQIHTLVNSNMTAAMQSEYDAVKRELAMMREVLDLKKAAGLAPTSEALAEIRATQVKLTELAARLDDRKRAQKRLDENPPDAQ